VNGVTTGFQFSSQPTPDETAATSDKHIPSIHHHLSEGWPQGCRLEEALRI